MKVLLIKIEKKYRISINYKERNILFVTIKYIMSY